MKVLVVEDDANKIELLKAYVIAKGFDLETAMSFKTAQCKILSNSYDLILLDMTIPTFDQDYKTKGGKWRSFGGEEVLMEMKRKGKSSKVFVITGYDKVGVGVNMITLGQMRNRLKENFPKLFIGAAHFDPFSIEWKDSLDRMLKREFNL